MAHGGIGAYSRKPQKNEMCLVGQTDVQDIAEPAGRPTDIVVSRLERAWVERRARVT